MISNKAEFEKAATELYHLEIQSRENDKQQKKLRGLLHTYMKANNVMPYSTDFFILEVTTRREYGVPTPARLREILGADAEHYITEVVSKEVRNNLPPQIAVELCPVVSESEFVRMKPLNNGK